MMQDQPTNNQHKQVKKARPKNLNLMTIRLPINALVSILHRATGCVLFLVLPLFLLSLQWSLSSDLHFQQVVELMHSWWIKLVLVGGIWAFSHHFFAGLRHLAMDVHWMTTLMKARYTSKIVLLLGFVVTGICVWQLYG